MVIVIDQKKVQEDCAPEGENREKAIQSDEEEQSNSKYTEGHWWAAEPSIQIFHGSIL